MQRAIRYASTKVEYNPVEFIIDLSDASLYATDPEYTTEDLALINEFGTVSDVLWLRDTYNMSLLDACKEYKEQQEELKWENETYVWLSDPKNWDSEIYSDVFKDLYGFRPRGIRVGAVI